MKHIILRSIKNCNCLFFLTTLLVSIFFSGKILAQPLADGQNKFLGNTINWSAPAEDWDNYWNQVTSENGGKWGTAESTRDQISWGTLDIAYNYARARGIPFRFHVLVWGQQHPTWIATLDSAEIYDEIEEYIRLCAEKYPDADYVEVLNEPLHFVDPGWPNAALIRQALGGGGATGYDYVIKAFELARKYFPPSAKLYLNEYSVIGDDNTTTAYLQIINLLKNRGLINGIAFQGHRFELNWASVNTMRNNLNRLAATGLPIQITEFDCGTDNNSQANEAYTLSEYQRIFPTLWEHPGIEGITLWGYIQGTMWQRNCYLIRADGTETPAFQWLRNYLSNGNVRSHQSGNWNNINTWEKHNGTAWIYPAPGLPSLSDKIISISNGHKITVTASDSTSLLNVDAGGTLTINPEVRFFVKSSQNKSMTVSGTVENFGLFEGEDSTAIRIIDGGTYFHKQNSGTIPKAVWTQGSTIILDSIKTSAPGNSNQNFYNIVWNNSKQTSNLNLGWNGNTIGGNITIQNSGTARFYMCSPASGVPATVTVRGDVIQTGGNFSTNRTGNGNTSVTINHYGNINVTGGNFSISRGSQGGTGTVAWNLFGGNFSMSNATTQNSNSNPGGAKFVFTGTGKQSLTLGAGNTLTALPIEINSGATLRTGLSVIEGSGIFTLNPGAALETAQPEGLDNTIKITGTLTLSKNANYGFNGTSNQITGVLLPDSVSNLTIDNSAGLTLSKPVTVNGILDVKNGNLLTGGNQLLFGNNSTLKYSGSSAQITTNQEFPESNGPKNLSINNAINVSLHASRTIPGSISLGGKLKLGNNNLTAASASSEGSNKYVVTDGTGSLNLTVGDAEKLFPVGTATLYAPVWIKNQGTSDNLGVRLENDSAPAAEGGRVNVKWNINEQTDGGGNYTLKFGWMGLLENSIFRKDRNTNAKIFNLSDTTEAGTGGYTTQFDVQPYTLQRGGFEKLGWFGVGRFGTVTGINEESEKKILTDEFVLNQNYPNPFNPSTMIGYRLPVTGNVLLKIYDVLGSEIKTLVNSYQTAGEHSVVWNGTDDSNYQVSSGIYFYKIEANENYLIKKMILLR